MGAYAVPPAYMLHSDGTTVAITTSRAPIASSMNDRVERISEIIASLERERAAPSDVIDHLSTLRRNLSLAADNFDFLASVDSRCLPSAETLKATGENISAAIAALRDAEGALAPALKTALWSNSSARMLLGGINKIAGEILEAGRERLPHLFSLASRQAAYSELRSQLIDQVSERFVHANFSPEPDDLDPGVLTELTGAIHHALDFEAPSLATVRDCIEIARQADERSGQAHTSSESNARFVDSIRLQLEDTVDPVEQHLKETTTHIEDHFMRLQTELSAAGASYETAGNAVIAASPQPAPKRYVPYRPTPEGIARVEAIFQAAVARSREESARKSAAVVEAPPELPSSPSTPSLVVDEPITTAQTSRTLRWARGIAACAALGALSISAIIFSSRQRSDGSANDAPPSPDDGSQISAQVVPDSGFSEPLAVSEAPLSTPAEPPVQIEAPAPAPLVVAEAPVELPIVPDATPKPPPIEVRPQLEKILAFLRRAAAAETQRPPTVEVEAPTSVPAEVAVATPAPIITLFDPSNLGQQAGFDALSTSVPSTVDVETPLFVSTETMSLGDEASLYNPNALGRASLSLNPNAIRTIVDVPEYPTDSSALFSPHALGTSKLPAPPASLDLIIDDVIATAGSSGLFEPDRLGTSNRDVPGIVPVGSFAVATAIPPTSRDRSTLFDPSQLGEKSTQHAFAESPSYLGQPSTTISAYAPQDLGTGTMRYPGPSAEPAAAPSNPIVVFNPQNLGTFSDALPRGETAPSMVTVASNRGLFEPHHLGDERFGISAGSVLRQDQTIDFARFSLGPQSSSVINATALINFSEAAPEEKGRKK